MYGREAKTKKGAGKKKNMGVGERSISNDEVFIKNKERKSVL